MEQGIFISYRRSTGSMMARMIYDRIRLEKGYRVFLDVEKLNAGDFRKNLELEMSKCDIFILVLSENALERTASPDDNVRAEILAAKRMGLRFIPVTTEAFVWPQQIQEDLAEIRYYNAIPYIQVYSEQFFERLYDFIDNIRGNSKAETVIPSAALKNGRESTGPAASGSSGSAAPPSVRNMSSPGKKLLFTIAAAASVFLIFGGIGLFLVSRKPSGASDNSVQTRTHEISGSTAALCGSRMAENVSESAADLTENAESVNAPDITPDPSDVSAAGDVPDTASAFLSSMTGSNPNREEVHLPDNTRPQEAFSPAEQPDDNSALKTIFDQKQRRSGMEDSPVRTFVPMGSLLLPDYAHLRQSDADYCFIGLDEPFSTDASGTEYYSASVEIYLEETDLTPYTFYQSDAGIVQFSAGLKQPSSIIDIQEVENLGMPVLFSYGIGHFTDSGIEYERDCFTFLIEESHCMVRLVLYQSEEAGYDYFYDFRKMALSFRPGGE